MKEIWKRIKLAYLRGQRANTFGRWIRLQERIEEAL